jgi:uncharacterized delta-60 repeat protein
MTFAVFEECAFRVWHYKRLLALLRLIAIAGSTLVTLLLTSPTFAAFANGTGIARVPNPTSSDQGYGIALQSDGKIVVAGRCGESGAKLCVARFNADGTMDETFNATGAVPGKRVIDGLAVHASSFLRGVKVAVAADGKIVVATTCEQSTVDNFCVARLNPDGSFDQAFDGPDTLNPGNGRFGFRITPNLGEALSDFALQRIDGRILLVGQCANYACVVRLKASDGSFDTDTGDFGLVGPPAADRPPSDPAVNGRFLYRFPSKFNSAGVSDAIAIETTNEGKIVIAGTCGTSALELCLTKFNRDGSFDTDFRGDSLPVGQGGRVRIVTVDESGNDVKQRAADVKIQSDGRFLVQCGYFRTSSWSQCMYRINSGGDVATSFSSGLPFPSEPGRVVYNAIGDALAFAITPGTSAYSGRIVTLGNCDGVGGFTGGTTCVTAIRNGTVGGIADGVIDASLIGPNGDQAGTFYFRTRGLTVRNNNTREIVANSGGEFFVVGECDSQMCVYKFRPDGALDTGLCLDDVDGDGKVSAASDGLAIMRNMLGVPTNANVPPGHGYDIDGDGVLNASRDGLLLVRRMLGFTDAAVLGGITFAPHARRTTWIDIEAYLRMRCRIPRSQIVTP